jgi:hypothetical protein
MEITAARVQECTDAAREDFLASPTRIIVSETQFDELSVIASESVLVVTHPATYDMDVLRTWAAHNDVWADFRGCSKTLVRELTTAIDNLDDGTRMLFLLQPTIHMEREAFHLHIRAWTRYRYIEMPRSYRSFELPQPVAEDREPRFIRIREANA